MSSLGELIRTRRLALGMKQTTLAYRAGVSQGAISDIEKGRRVNLTRDLLERIAGALEMPLSELVMAPSGEPTTIQLPEDVPPALAGAFLVAIRFLNPRQQEAALRFVQSLAAEAENAHQEARQARRELVEPVTDEARPVEQNGQQAKGL